jgi:hypothetical protein
VIVFPAAATSPLSYDNQNQPFLSAVPSGTIIAKGDALYIHGMAGGDPSYLPPYLKLYIFGPNKFIRESITVEDDRAYEKKLDIGYDWASNQYYVIIENPMYNDKIDIKYVNEALYLMSVYTNSIQSWFFVKGPERLQGSQEADALTKMIYSSNIDDIYTKLTFNVEEPWIKIVSLGDQASGSKFTITGTTNLAVEDQILVEVASPSFTASGITKVVTGEGTYNTWSIGVDTTNWRPDQYTIKVNGIEVDVTTTTNINLVEKVGTTTPTTGFTQQMSQVFIEKMASALIAAIF